MKKTILIVSIFLSGGLMFTACTGNNNKATTEPLTKNEIYTCRMHNEVLGNHTGQCPKCNMDLIKQKMTADQKKIFIEGTYEKPKK